METITHRAKDVLETKNEDRKNVQVTLMFDFHCTFLHIGNTNKWTKFSFLLY